jgi:hypothetical protein
MKIAYYIRYFDATGGLLRFDSVQCTDEVAAKQKAFELSLPEGCISIEVAWESGPVWQGNAAEFESIH